MDITVAKKFILCIILSAIWIAFCFWFSLPWILDLAEIITIVPAVMIVAFIALLPGFMYMFLLMSYLIDKRPVIETLEVYPPLTVLIAAYNEEEHIASTLFSLGMQEYAGEMEVIVIDDGSTDNTIKILNSSQAESALNLIVIKQNKNAGKAAALNVGLNKATHDLIVTLDADTQLAAEAIKHIVENLYSGTCERAAVAGSVYAKNPRDSLITKIQEWDYFNAIAPVKRMQSLYRGTLVAQGAFSIYKKKQLLEVGGWPDTVGEDIVVTWAFLDKGYRVDFSEDAISFTNVPESYKKFFFQRARWSRGMLEAFRLHPHLLLKTRLTMLLIYWDLLLPIVDLVYFFVFIPGLLLAFFGHFYIVGPMTLAILPLGIINNYMFYRGQKKLFAKHGIKRRRNTLGFMIYFFLYQIIMSPAVLYGYWSEITQRKKKWGTK